MDGNAMHRNNAPLTATALTALIKSALTPALPAVLAATLMLSGCVPQQLQDDETMAAEQQSNTEAAMREQWVDKPYRELVKHMGRKGLVLDIPRYGWPPSSAVVFGMNDATGCVDSFLVIHGKEPMIKDYFCR